MAEQQELAFRTWGGRRHGAGRRSAQERARIPHVGREAVRAYQPVHVTLRMADHVWNLRSERSYAVIHRALEAARRRPDARVVHFSVQGNHVHLIVEAEGSRALANAVRALSIRLARGLNRMMGRSGSVFADRYHAHVLRTPAEVRNALRYVVGNFASHAARRGKPPRSGWVDPFSSASVKAPRTAQRVLFAEAVTRPAGTWLGRSAEASVPGRKDGAGGVGGRGPAGSRERPARRGTEAVPHGEGDLTEHGAAAL
jgi:REP element-mobilizing transposase RayT